MRWRPLRENIEALTVAILLALIIRHFFVESYEIPTGSMAPGLNGLHVSPECPNCGTKNHVGISSDSLTNRIQFRNFLEIYDGICPVKSIPIKVVTSGKPNISCPVCKQSHSTAGSLRRAQATAIRAWCRECTYIFPVVVEHSDILGGNKILVDKFAYDWQDPNRWDVVVFKFNRERNYIKRLIGLPGETIQVIDGDIWIDGKLEAKPIDVQSHFWTLIHDSAVEEAGLIDSPWIASAGWTPKGGGWGFNQLQGKGELRYTRSIDNRYNYNSIKHSSRPVGPVRDISLKTTLNASRGRNHSPARLNISIWNHPSEYRVSFPFGSGDTELLLLRPEQETVSLGRVSDFVLKPGHDYQIDAQIVDRTMRLIIDGEVVANVKLPVSELDSGTRGIESNQPASGFSISAINCGGQIQSVQLYRDQHWTQAAQHATSKPFKIEKERYFVLGDNSPSSLDSRWWGSFGKSNLLGRGFSIFWPALPGRNESGFIR
ncbi:MAG: signal peptidase I [Planctomycetota bacterium]|nr:signal peptidase I [Planctomycetota bacterium]